MIKKKIEKEIHEPAETDDLDAFDELSDLPSEGPAEVIESEFEVPIPKPQASSAEAGAPEENPASIPPKHAAQELADSLIELAPDVPVNLVAVIGKTTTNVGDLLKYRIGRVIELGRPPGESVDVVANGRLIARGELVDIDGQLGVKILKMVK